MKDFKCNQFNFENAFTYWFSSKVTMFSEGISDSLSLLQEYRRTHHSIINLVSIKYRKRRSGVIY